MSLYMLYYVVLWWSGCLKLHVAYLFPLFFMYISPKLMYLCHSGFRQLLPNLANTSLNISSVVVSFFLYECVVHYVPFTNYIN